MKDSDFIALQNLKFISSIENKKTNIRCAIIYPISNKYNYEENNEKIMEKYGTIMYKKKIILKMSGFINLVKEIYRGESWIGGLFPDDNCCLKKVNLTKEINNNENNQVITYYLYYFDDPKKDIEMKDEIRKCYNLGKNSIHITDFFEDTYRVSTALLNNNSIFFLNEGTNNITIANKNLLKKYFENANKDDFCITSGIILELFKLRETIDIDYLHYNDIKLNIKNISPHVGKWLEYYEIHKHDIIYNPNNHFYINGFKFITLDCLKNMKIKRNEEKDKKDIILIDDFIRKL
jgi:hypothetical protein